MLLLLKVVFLDPWLKVKALSFLSPLEKELLRAAIEEETAVVSESIESSQEAPTKRAKGEHQLLELLDDVVQPTEDEQLTIIHFQMAHTEVTRYQYQTACGLVEVLRHVYLYRTGRHMRYQGAKPPSPLLHHQ